LKAAAVEAREGAGYLLGEEGVVAGGDEEIGDGPDVFFSGHPVEVVDAGEMDGAGVGAEGALAAEVVVVLDVAEGQLAEGAVDGGAEAEAGEVGLGDGSPEAAFAIEGEDVVVIADGFQIHEQRGMALDAEGGGGQQGSFKAVAFALAEGATGRARGVRIGVGEGVEEFLDAGWGSERAEGAQFGGGEAEGLAGGGLGFCLGWLPGLQKTLLKSSWGLYRGGRWAA
jgi:hypothetical protein